jgi:hypothetical protein
MKVKTIFAITLLTGLVFASPAMAGGRCDSDVMQQSVDHDFDGDGIADLLWYNEMTGHVIMWITESDEFGDLFRSPFNVATIPLVWQIEQVSDFDGDCMADILWRKDSGSVVIWLMNGPEKVDSFGFGSPPPVWQLR